MQLLREQIFELQSAVIEKLSVFHGESVIKTKSEDQVELKGVVEEWIDPLKKTDPPEQIEIEFEEGEDEET